jgi:hypothetical protein
MFYQLGWTTLPGLRGLSVSEFRAAPTEAPDRASGGREAADERGVAVEFANEQQLDEFLRVMEEHFAVKRFTNAADAFDTVKVFALEQAARNG